MPTLLQVRFYWLIPVLFWAVLIGASLSWNLASQQEHVNKLAAERAATLFDMVKMTKINPDVMVSDEPQFRMDPGKGIRFRIVSNRPENPDNITDTWERAALDRLKVAGEFVFEQMGNERDGVFRYIAPVFMESLCLDCHEDLGYQVGDLRGGISIDVSVASVTDIQKGVTEMLVLVHLGGYFLITLTTIGLMQRLRSQWRMTLEGQSRLSEREAFLASITDTMGEGCMVLESGGKLSYLNPMGERLLGWSQSELVGRSLHDEVHVYSDGSPVDAQSCAVSQTLADGQPRKVDDECFRRRDGSLMPVSYSVSAKGEVDSIQAAVLVFDDISERLKAEKEHARLERQLNQTHKMEAVGQLAGGIAHEINTPTQYIGDNLRFLRDANTDLADVLDQYKSLLDASRDVPQLAKLAEAVGRSLDDYEIDYLQEEIPNAISQSIAGTEQVARIVLAMKEFAHPGSKKLEPADLNKIVENAVAVSRNEWKYVAEATTELAENMPPVQCMGGDISQVVLNFIVNAAHAIADKGDGKKGRILVGTEVIPGMVQISVSDTGAGIPTAIREQVFNPFFTTKAVGKGTGQGLAIAQDIVVGKHRGDIGFDTEEGKGSTFYLRLPLHQDDDGSADSGCE